MIVSKFEKLYILRIFILPIIYIGLSILLIDIKMNYKKDLNIKYVTIFLLILAFFVLLYNLNSIYKIVVENTKVTKIYLLTQKKEIIPNNLIKSFNKEFIDGGWISDVGQISNGYNRYIFKLHNGKDLIISPLFFKNYNELIMAINNNMNNIIEHK